MSNLSPFLGPTFTTNTNMLRNPSWSLKISPPVQQMRLELSENEEHISRHLDKVNNDNVKLSAENIDDDEDVKSAEDQMIKLMAKNSIQESQSSVLAATNDELKVFHVDEEEQQQASTPSATQSASTVCFNVLTSGVGRPPFLPVRPNTSVPLFTTATLSGINTIRPQTASAGLVFSSTGPKLHSTLPTPAFSRSSSLNSLNSCLADDDLKSIHSSVASEYSQCMGPSNKYKKSTNNMERVNESDDPDDDYQDKSQNLNSNNQGDVSVLTEINKPDSPYALSEVVNSSFMVSQRNRHKEQQAYCREKAMTEGVRHLIATGAATSNTTIPTVPTLPPVTRPVALPAPQFKFQQANLNHSPATRDTFNPTDLPKPFAVANQSYAFLNSTNTSVGGQSGAPLPAFMLAKQPQAPQIIPPPFTQQFKFNTPPQVQPLQPAFQFNTQPNNMVDNTFYDNDVLRVYPQPRPKQITNLISAHASPPESVCSHMSDLSIPSMINQDIAQAKSSNLQDLYRQLNLNRPNANHSTPPVCQNLSNAFNQIDHRQPVPIQRAQNVIDSMSSSSSKTASSSSTPSTTNWARNNQQIVETSDEEENEEVTDAFINRFFAPNSPASPSTAFNNTIDARATTAPSDQQDATTSKRNMKRTSLQNFDIRPQLKIGLPKRQPSLSNTRSSISSIGKKTEPLTTVKATASSKAPISSTTKPVQSKIATTSSQASQSNAPVINMTKAAQLRAAAVNSKQTASTKSTTTFSKTNGVCSSPVKSLTKSGVNSNSSYSIQRRKSLIIAPTTSSTASSTSQRLSSNMTKPSVKQSLIKSTNNQIKLNK